MVENRIQNYIIPLQQTGKLHPAIANVDGEGTKESHYMQEYLQKELDFRVMDVDYNLNEFLAYAGLPIK